MAQRFGGKYSPRPQGDVPAPRPNAFDGKRRAKGTGRTKMMLFPAVIFLIRGFQGGSGQMIAGVAAFACIVLAAFLTREGIKAEQAYDARRVAKRPAFPRKIFGAVLTGIGVGAGAIMRGDAPIFPLLFGLLAAGLHLAAFGPDPMRHKGVGDDFQNDRVARAVEEGEKHLAAMRSAILRVNDGALEARVDRFAAAAHALFRRVEDDPGDLTAARKYLGVYLMGARDATVKFADLYAIRRDASVRADYEALLTDLETTFASRSTALLQNDRTDLDVEIAVLRERLQRDAPLTER